MLHWSFFLMLSEIEILFVLFKKNVNLAMF